MRIPAKLIKSRHGVYYYRFQFHDQSRRREHRFSLHTKCPVTAKSKAIRISAIILQYKLNGAGMSSNFNPNDPANLLGNLDDIRKLDIELPNGVTLRNINTAEDIENAQRMMEFLNISSQEDKTRFIGTTAPRQATSAAAEPQGGMTIDEIIQRFATRNKTTLTTKTLYEYGNCQRHFSDWFATRKGKKDLPIRLVTREDIAVYIDELLAKPVSPGTIKQKYMAALNGIFTLAQSSGAYPKGEIPTKGHKIVSKTKLAQQQLKTGWKPFTNDELVKIFSPETFLKQNRPADFWLPLLALFTGARIEELCQLLLDEDIRQVGEGDEKVWTITITDISEDGSEVKHVKTAAARRVIPMHPKLIELGFLEYVKDARQFGNRLFPYLTPDRFGKYHGTPSERFGKYLDSLGMTHRTKVFHSFRKTTNNKLKQSKVSEEERCQFVGHKHETTNSRCVRLITVGQHFIHHD